MKEKDPKIESELKSLSERNLPDADKILAKARAEMRKPKPAAKPVFAARRFFAVAASLAVVVLLIVFAVRFPFAGDRKGDGTMSPSDPAPEAPVFYSSSEILGRKAEYAEAAAIFASAFGDTAFPVPDPAAGEMQTVSLDCYAYRLRETGADVLLACRLRIYDEHSGFDELVLYFELTDATYSAHKDYLDLPRKSDGLAYVQGYEGGEYVSQAYIENKYRCMLVVMNGTEYRLEHYLDVLFGMSQRGEAEV